jgi:hypothetical protein
MTLIADLSSDNVHWIGFNHSKVLAGTKDSIDRYNSAVVTTHLKNTVSETN